MCILRIQEIFYSFIFSSPSSLSALSIHISGWLDEFVKVEITWKIRRLFEPEPSSILSHPLNLKQLTQISRRSHFFQKIKYQRSNLMNSEKYFKVSKLNDFSNALSATLYNFPNRVLILFAVQHFRPQLIQVSIFHLSRLPDYQVFRFSGI